jgi:hypothetical protein
MSYYLMYGHENAADNWSWHGLVRAQSPSQTSNESVAVAGITDFKHVLFPILDRNPYLSEATRQVWLLTFSPQTLLWS